MEHNSQSGGALAASCFRPPAFIKAECFSLKQCTLPPHIPLTRGLCTKPSYYGRRLDFAAVSQRRTPSPKGFETRLTEAREQEREQGKSMH